MIVRLNNKNKNKEVAEFCERLLEIDGTEKRETPQRCFIRYKTKNLASIGPVEGGVSIEFKPRSGDYAEAHGSAFIKPHGNAVLAKEGWLLAYPGNKTEFSRVVNWVIRSAA